MPSARDTITPSSINSSHRARVSFPNYSQILFLHCSNPAIAPILLPLKLNIPQ